METYTVRNASGQFLGSYRASSATAAISALCRDQNVYRSQFRRSVSIDAATLTASVEAERSAAELLAIARASLVPEEF